MASAVVGCVWCGNGGYRPSHCGVGQHGLSPEESSTEVPHLSLAQVYAALTYYHANRDEIEADIAAEDAEAQRLETQHARQMNMSRS